MDCFLWVANLSKFLLIRKHYSTHVALNRVAISDGRDPNHSPIEHIGQQVHVTFRSTFNHDAILQQPTETWIRKAFLGKGKLSDVSIKIYNLNKVRLTYDP